MTRISQLLSVVGPIASDTTAQLAAVQEGLANEGLLTGLDKRYRPREDGGVVLPDQSKLVRVTAEGALGEIARLFTRQLDVARTLDEAKTHAFASVRVDGQELLSDVTTDHLLYLEGELAKLHAIVSRMPTLDQATNWNEDGVEAGQHKSDPVETTSSKPSYHNHVLSEAKVIDGHPFEAKVQVYQQDDVQGYWTTVNFSGALYPQYKRRLLDRITQLRAAVKFAREEANTAEVTDVHEGAAIFGWLLRP